MNKAAIAAMATLALAGCASDRVGTVPAPVARAMLTNASGEQRATATFTPIRDGLRITVSADGMTPGVYAAHIHAIGKCDAPDFMSAGGHWNPAMRQHGKDNPMGAHKGDLPNLTVAADGRGTVSSDIVGVSLNGPTNALIDADGAAVVIHKAADDYRTDPTGNAGGRQACGVVPRD